MRVKALFLLAVLGAASALAELRVTEGAVNYQVFQRDFQNHADIPLAGSSPVSGTVEARVVRQHWIVPGFDWQKFGAVSGGKWSGTLTSVPAGGPYRIELRVGQETTAVDGVLVGDIWILAGQSNMQGVGNLVDVEMPNELVHNFNMADEWMIAEEPLHILGLAADRVHWPRRKGEEPVRQTVEEARAAIAARNKGAGLGLPFAVEMVRRNGVPIGLLACAHGGTSMDQWDPALLPKGGDSLYGSMVRRVKAAGGKAVGLLWYQGESDASAKAAPLFQEKFERFVAHTRKDLELPNLPFYYVQIGRHVSPADGTGWNIVQEAQRVLATKIPNAGFVAAVDFSLDDQIHVGTQDLKRLGKRLANVATGMAHTPQPQSAIYKDGVLTATFAPVHGRLQAPGRIAGFSIHGTDGAPIPLIHKALVDPADGGKIHLYLGGPIPEGATLRYGYGRDPYCNVRDDADMGLAVFGPLAIERAR